MPAQRPENVVHLRIDQSVIREILARTDLATLIGGYVALRKRGSDLVGLCPFHAEKTPSLHVHPDRGFFKCFGCGAGGDAIKFLGQIESLPFPEAARELAKRAGLELEPENPAAARVRGEKEQIYAANALAAAYFARMLRLGPEGAAARRYCRERGLSEATIEAFGLGFAPESWDGLVRELGTAGVDLAVAERAGLVKAGERGYYDFYRGRLMVPTHATTGETIAFGGRALDGSEPKYLNTRATPVYSKGRGLFALERARRSAAESDALLVVEGYLDCIALHQAGFTNAVASLGTAFTPEQAAELRKYAERIFVCFDADAAGRAATAKSIDVLLGVGCAAFIVQLPAGEDPDTFVRTHGPSAFQARLDAALPWVQFKLDAEIATIAAKRLPAGQAARTAELLIAALPREEWDRWRVYVAGALGLAVDDLRKSRFVSNPANFVRPAGRGSTGHVAAAAEPPPMEREILAAMIDEPALVSEYADRIPSAVFRDARYRGMYDVLLERRDALVTAADVYAAFGTDRDAADALATLQKPDRSPTPRFKDSAARRAHLDGVVERLVEGAMERRKRELNAKIDLGEAVSEAERDECLRLVEELDKRKAKRLSTKAAR